MAITVIGMDQNSSRFDASWQVTVNIGSDIIGKTRTLAPKTGEAFFMDEIMDVSGASAGLVVELVSSTRIYAIGLLFSGSTFTTAPALVIR